MESIKGKHVKVFISLPMSGRTAEEINAEYEKIKAVAKKVFVDDTVEFIDQRRPDSDAPKDIVDKGHISVWHMSLDIGLMAEADVVIFSKNYLNSKGCIIEEKVATDYGMHTIYM